MTLIPEVGCGNDPDDAASSGSPVDVWRSGSSFTVSTVGRAGSLKLIRERKIKFSTENAG